MYWYLIAVVLAMVIWGVLFYARRDLRIPAIWTGFSYMFFIIGTFILWKILSIYFYLGEPIIPSYYNPDTLFNLANLTGGRCIEDLMFCFFGAGLAVFSYEFLFRKKINRKQIYSSHYLALLVALGTLIFVWFLFKLNLIYLLIISSFVGAACLWIDKKDLIEHSLIGGFSFMFIHVLLAVLCPKFKFQNRKIFILEKFR